MTALAAGRISEPPRPAAYPVLSLADLVSSRGLGAMHVESAVDLLGHPHMGARVRVAGRLKAEEPEGGRLTAPPRFYTLYQIEHIDEGDRMWRISLDLDRVDREERRIAESFCGGPIACAVTVRGRVGEVAAERVVNLFSPGRDFTAMIGIIAERLEFSEAAR